MWLEGTLALSLLESEFESKSGRHIALISPSPFRLKAFEAE